MRLVDTHLQMPCGCRKKFPEKIVVLDAGSTNDMPSTRHTKIDQLRMCHTPYTQTHHATGTGGHA
jgi:hypothetical protein